MRPKAELTSEIIAERRAKKQARTARWEAKTPDKLKAKQIRQNNKRRLAARGLTEAEHDAILASQNGVCAICRGPPQGRCEQFAIDHDHETGVTRGLLCAGCNLSLGGLENHWAAATAYLRKHGKTIDNSSSVL